MDARKFAIGDQVRLLLDIYANDNPGDVYTVSRALPATANVWQYRVKRVSDGQERAVGEQQLAKAGPQELSEAFATQAQQDARRARADSVAAQPSVTPPGSGREKR